MLVGAVVILGGGADCPAPGPTPTEQARNSIPASALAIYQQAGRRHNIDWAFLASIGAQECDHGRCAGAKQINASGCGGPMQIAMRRGSPCSAGGGPTLWERYRQDGDGDGRADPFSFADSVDTAAVILRRAKGAPPIGGTAAAYRHAACAYYGACADAAVAYADQVMARAAVYGFRGGQPTPSRRRRQPRRRRRGRLRAAGWTGARRRAAANCASRPASTPASPPLIRAIGERIAGLYGQPLVVTSARRPGAITVNGNVSDHASGNALDFGMAANGGTNDGPVGDRIAAAASSSPAGTSPARSPGRATAASSTSIVAGLRIQLIWKTDEGGNHHDHVHVGVRVIA